jgi:hypothetical protein
VSSFLAYRSRRPGLSPHAVLVSSCFVDLRHPQNELRSLVQYGVWHEPKRDITSVREHATSGWDRQSMRDCWAFLDLTSRSFAAVIKELDGELARVVSTPLGFLSNASTP